MPVTNDERRQRGALMLLDEARAQLGETLPDYYAPGKRQVLSLGRLMQSMASWAGGPRATRSADDAREEWGRAFANAQLLETTAPDLQGVGGRFASRFGFRDTAIVDFDWLRMESRALGISTGAKGGYLVGVDTMPVADPLWQDSTIGVTGVQILEGLSSSLAIPRGTGAVTASWQSGEGGAPTAVDETLGSVSVTPKAVIATVQCSVQLARQALGAQEFLARLLLRTLRELLDNALLQGTGASGQPQGLANLPTASGIQQVSGTSLAWAGILNAQRLASASGVTDSRMTWVGAPTVRETIAARERTSGSGRTLWDDGKIAGNPALATPDAPASTLFVGDFSQALLALFGPGIELRFDPANNFNTGLVAWQVLAVSDIVFLQPSGFVRITSIT